MKLLIIGGTMFLGRHIVEAALARGHEITLFNRGNTNPDLFPEVEKLRGDRQNDLSALQGRKWDVAIDTCGYVPRVVKMSAELLADAVEHYTFISSISVYSDFSVPNMNESGPVGKLEDESVEEITGETYGPLKVLCEKADEAAMPGRVLNVRSGLIVGPYDPTDRFTYWPVRVQRGGDVLAAVAPDYKVQFIDGRDLAAWCVLMAEKRKAGTYNVTGRPTNLGDVLDSAKRISKSDANIIWADESFLTEHEVGPWIELPMWLTSDMKAMNLINVDKAVGDGLTFHSVDDTVRATLDWFATLPADRPKRAGLDPAKEAKILEAWKARVMS
jgi:2'-hydroxyisoflavone reductase